MPPTLARRFLHWFLRDDLLEEVEGDLEEQFYRTLEHRSVFRAKLRYWYQVFHYLRPFAIKNIHLPYTLYSFTMFNNYLKIGLRNLLKSRFFSFINISGMAVSIASFLVIALYVVDELKYDQHITGVSQKYRVFCEYFSEDGSVTKQAMVPPMIGPTLLTDYPEVVSYTRFLHINSGVLFKVNDKKFAEDQGGYADPTVFDMFSLRLSEGNLSTALKEPNSLAISETLARKYFGHQPALGQRIEVSDESYQVTAVFKDFPEHSHLQLDYFLAMEGLIQAEPEPMQRWNWNQFHTYIEVTPGTRAGQLEDKLLAFAKRHAWPITKAGNGTYYIPHLMPVTNVHLYASDQLWDIAVRGNIYTVYMLSTAALFILVIAILNFVNLSTARAVTRTKEVGIRKVMGAFRRQLIHQFIAESIITALIALGMGGAIAVLVLPSLNSFAEKSIPSGIFLDPLMWVMMLVFALLVGVAAGAYPAFYISGYQPVKILSREALGSSGKSWLRKGMVVFQFVLSFCLIIASLVVSEQYAYMRTSDMGFDKDNLIVMKVRGGMESNLKIAKRAFTDHPSIMSATMGYGLPGEAYAGDGIRDKASNKEYPISMLTVDRDYVKTLGLKVVAGRDFSEDFPSDERHAFIISEAAAKLLGYSDPEDALQHELVWPRWDAPDSLKEGAVIGVVKDFHLNSLRENISPVVLHMYPEAYNTLTLRVKPENVPATLAYLESTWKEFNAEWPFDYKFLDDNFDQLYKAEEKLATLFRFFTAFTILVACLGLFGLVVYSTSQKFKEISIRKVLGASEVQLVAQLARTYTLLIGIAFVFAAPFSYYAAYQWLQKFSFRISITPMLFVKAGFLIMMIAVVTVGLQSYKASRNNPVEALKE